MSRSLCGLMLLSGCLRVALAQYPGWQHQGSLHVLTTPDGADLPAAASEEGFPLLVRLHQDFFDFSQAQAGGEDIRFSTSTGVPLAYQVEEWDAARGTASLWVRVPAVQGNARQEIRLHWGQANAVSESNGAAVFNASNGYLSVWHMNDPVRDEVGSLESINAGTTPTAGLIGPARHLAGEQGVFGGDAITRFPTGASPHSSEAWFRPEKPNATVLGWGNEEARGKVVMQFRSPPHVNMDCYFSGANVRGRSTLPMNLIRVGQTFLSAGAGDFPVARHIAGLESPANRQAGKPALLRGSSPVSGSSMDQRLALNAWIHVVHTYQPGDSRVYVNGILDGVSTTPQAPLAIKSPARLWLGGWYGHYDFVGDLDEVRISKVARSADWVRLQYENQKPLQTLVGLVVQPGREFSVSPAQATVLEGRSAEFSAKAGGAQKLYWVLKREGRETLVAVDRFQFTFDAGRVIGDASATLQFRAIYANEIKTLDIPITVREDIPEPVFALEARAAWDGRQTIEVVPRIANVDALHARGAGTLDYVWTVAGLAVIKEVLPGKLLLTRAQNSGELTTTATLNNGGEPVSQTATIDVTEPKRDPWVQRLPARDEQPQDGQFYARDDQNEGTLFYRGALAEAADSLFLRLYAGDQLLKTENTTPAADRSYAFAVKLNPGLIKYNLEFGAKVGGRESVLRTVTNIVCGDAYLIEGQSNALATDTNEKSPPETNEWIRSYGHPPENPQEAPGNLWCNPVWKAEHGEMAELGWWGMELAKRLLESQQVPIFILNAAVGGTRIDQHQRNAADPTDLTTIYGRMLWRLRQARLTHGIRAILWHQGESDQGADGPTGGYGWETYQPFFVDMSAAWKQDLPNVQHYYVFQIWPDACSMGGRNGSGDRLREQQRTLPRLYSNLSLMSTLGIRPPGGCHFPLAGWAEFARLIQPLLERDLYGKVPSASITPPDLRHASYAGSAKDTIALEFDQPVIWADTLVGQFYLDGEKDRIASGSVSGNVLLLKLKEASTATRITYLKETAWSQDTLLFGANGLAALTFCDVALRSPRPDP